MNPFFGCCALIVLLVAGCDPNHQPETSSAGGPATTQGSEAAIRVADPLAFALAPHRGDSPADREIIQLQERLRQSPGSAPLIERLGWAFVSKARASFDPGYYRLAEHCALVLENRQPGSPEVLLLRGHLLHQEHRFREAEPLARQLATSRGMAADFGLLGDVLMEQGRLDEAVEAYQQMMDQRPDLHAYARGAHVRWLKGDLAGARELLEMAVGAASPQAPEAAAWVSTRLAQLQFQGGDRDAADETCQAALNYQADYAPALLLRGRLLLSEETLSEAIPLLQQAVRINPLPEYQWTLAEALRADDREDEARRVEEQLVRTGAATDPRTFALYLATRGESADIALGLAADELEQRADVFTHDAVAWANAAAGRIPEAWQEMQRALAEGTQDARLFFHATVIAAKAGRRLEAAQCFDRAAPLMAMLLPSERDQLLLALPESPEPSDDTAISVTTPVSANDP